MYHEKAWRWWCQEHGWGSSHEGSMPCCQKAYEFGFGESAEWRISELKKENPDLAQEMNSHNIT